MLLAVLIRGRILAGLSFVLLTNFTLQSQPGQELELLELEDFFDFGFETFCGLT